MEKIALEITLCGGVWRVNGKRLNELNHVEAKFLNDFFAEIKTKDSQF